MSLLHVVVIEERPLLRAAWVALIKTIPDMWVAEVHDSVEFFTTRRERYPADVVVIGCPDAGRNCSVLSQVLAEEVVGLPVVLITGGGPQSAMHSVPAVVKGVVSHQSTAIEMARIIRSVAEGQSSVRSAQQNASQTAPV